MTKLEYVAEMLSEELEHYQITPELIKQCAEGIVHGLDMWYEPVECRRMENRTIKS